jgi:hypothetical protein
VLNKGPTAELYLLPFSVPWITGNFLKAEELLALHKEINPVVLIYESLLYIYNGSMQTVSPMQRIEIRKDKANH